jgi:hypothetical protein
MPLPITRGSNTAVGYGLTGGGVSAVTANYLVVAGGGGGGAIYGAGGGGAGGYLTGTTTLIPTTSYAIIVGAGGNGAVGRVNGATGNNSVFNSITAAGGGYGAGDSSGSIPGGAGGSGGGGSANNGAAGGAGNTPSTSPSQGNSGARAVYGLSSYGGGGGGGAGAAGSVGTVGVGGVGGNGTASSITGNSITYAGGGGGSGENAGASGGTGGGGAGTGNATVGGNGTSNLGGGGGAGGGAGAPGGGNGGSGVVIISYAGAQQFGGGIVTSSGGNTIHTFTTSGTLTPLSSLTASYLIVAGGGSGGGQYYGGGGGAGGLLSGSNLTIDTNSSYNVVVGAGGSSVSSGIGNNGSNSSFSIVSTTAVGGGAGAGYSGQAAGNSGGSGGGGDGANAQKGAGGSGTSGQGNAGGAGFSNGSSNLSGTAGGGGGGAGGVGTTSTGAGATNGGVGLTSSILPYANAQSLGVGQVVSTSVYYAGGGGGGTFGSTTGVGGYGGGGNGSNSVAATSGSANTGGGGGGADSNTGSATSGNGGSGVVIISYPGSVQQMAGGQVVIAGGNVIHIFTSTGLLTPLKLTSDSLRFNSTNQGNLKRTLNTSGNRQTWTWSGWVKRGSLNGASTNTPALWLSSDAATGSAYLTFGVYNVTGAIDTLHFNEQSGGSYDAYTNAVFKDTSAWYHIVCAYDTTQAVAANRVKIYVNGSLQSMNSSSTYPTQNTNGYVNYSAYTHRLGAYNGSTATYQFDGYMAEVNFVDGQALTPTSFGTYNSYGIWQPITYSGSYGTNGFYLPFNKGPLNYAGYFNGSNQSLTIANNSAFNLTTGNWTIEGWFNTSTPGASAATNTLFCVGNPIQIYAQSNTVAMYVSSTNGGAYFVNPASGPANSVIANVWNHFACVKNGNNYTTYVNGIAGVTVTSATAPAVSTGANGIGYYPPGNNVFFSGLISNIRVVNGTAVYNSNFVPSTSPLTATSGTQLLTLQNSTIVDNSSNAFSITNNGSTTISQQYPFSVGVFNDQGPAGNNFTPQNITVGTSTAYASTLDLMNDSPTLTNSTASNYAVLNPLLSSSTYSTPVLSNGNLTALFSYPTNSNIAASISISSNKYYWELTWTYEGHGIIVGIDSNIYFTGGNQASGGLSTGYGYYNATGNKYNNNASSTYGAAWFTTGNTYVIGVAFDATNGTLAFYLNGANQGTAFTGIPAGAYFPTAAYGSGSGSSTVYFNFGQQPFQYTPPTGFLALNTYNLPAPTIPNGRLYMDATLWSGGQASPFNVYNAATFKPDFVWTKERTQAAAHRLYDSVRGTGISLGSNSSGAEATETNPGVSSFNSNGFTITNTYSPSVAPYLNDTSQTYVAWQWQAGQGTTSTNTAGTITSTVSVSTSSGFSIVTYTGTGANATVGHGLGAVPSIIFFKNRSATANWVVYNINATTAAASGRPMYLNTTNAEVANGAMFNYPSTNTTTVFNIGTDSTTNGSGNSMIAYCWAPIAGYSAFGIYTGNGSATGPFVYCGFQPKYILVKDTSNNGDWNVIDAARDSYNYAQHLLLPDSNGAEATGSGNYVNILSNGFQIANTTASFNASSDKFLYMAFASNPFKYANAF